MKVMMMPRWTDEQQLAIDKENSNIIVSAGAGSGKTAVLTARVLRKLKSGVNVNELLILTFTNKAAFEMKDRIRKAISKNEDIIGQLDYIDSSYITTFDSFALSMVKKYSYLLNIGKNVSIADSSTIYLEKKKIIDSIFDRLYLEKNELFLHLLNDFTIKKDDDIKKYILDINDKLDLKYDKIKYLDNYIDYYYDKNNIDFLVKSYVDFLKNKIKEIDNLLTSFSNYVDSDFFVTFKNSFNNLLNSNTYEEIKNSLDFRMSTLPKNSEDVAKEYKENINDIVKELKELTMYDSETYLVKSLKSTEDYVKIIIDIIKELDNEINKFKRNLNIYEFTDISKMAIRILEENSVVLSELKYSFNEIMIDEYQDTSDLQEKFISMIENNNVYMVGDIKQSIYRFRNANPYLFKNKYDSYSRNVGGFKIDLTRNFRSREEVINNINLIFSLIMTDDVGGADYKTTHKMIFGNTSYSNQGKTNQTYDFEIYNYNYDKNIGFTQEEIEIFFIAKDIKKKVDEKYKIFDKDTLEIRDCSYNDFVILLDKSTNFDLYKKIFQYFNIPITKFNSTNLTEEIEIVLIKNILKLIINRRNKVYDVEFKYALTSILRSYLYEYTDQEIFNLVTSNNYNCSLLDVVDSIVERVDSLSLKEIIYEIIDKFDFYNKFILIGDVKNRINRMTSIINIFENMSSISYSVVDAYNYLNQLIEDEYKIEVKELDVIPNSVKIMTIHASKGLEFPICYFASMHSRFNIRDLNEKFMYNNKYGIITPYFDEGIGKTFVKFLLKNDYLSEEISEKIRLFYVALTRAKEKFIVVTSFPDKSINDIKKCRSFLDMLIYSKELLTPYIKDFNVDCLSLTHDYNLIKKSNYKEKIEKSSEFINIKEINIENNSLHKEKISKENHNLLDKDSLNMMNFGTIMHEAFEFIDFKNPNYDILELDDFYKKKIEYFISKIDTDNLVNVYKEYEFLYEENNEEYHGIIDLMLEYKDYIKIIDYKLKNVNDDNYINQLKNYKKYVEKKTNKKIELFLFSILDSTFTEII